MTPEKVKRGEYYVGSDNSGHEYLVPWAKREEFSAWSELPEDDESGWQEPEYAERIDGGTLVFSNPRIADWKEPTR